jgi:hypothetical protein
VQLTMATDVGAGPFGFGMSRDDIRTFAPGPVTAYRKVSWDERETDDLGEGVHVFYREGYLCEAIEVGEPSQLMLGASPLLGIPFRDAKKAILALDPVAVTDEDGITSIALGLALYCPAHAVEHDATAESALAFERGYYDD